MDQCCNLDNISPVWWKIKRLILLPHKINKRVTILLQTPERKHTWRQHWNNNKNAHRLYWGLSEIGCFKGEFSLQVKEGVRMYQVCPLMCSLCTTRTIQARAEVPTTSNNCTTGGRQSIGVVQQLCFCVQTKWLCVPVLRSSKIQPGLNVTGAQVPSHWWYISKANKWTLPNTNFMQV